MKTARKRHLRTLRTCDSDVPPDAHLTQATQGAGKRALRFDFVNTGERANRYVMSLELNNEAGELVRKASQTRGLLYPGSGARQQFDLGVVPRGAYTAVLVADGGGDQIFGGQFKVAY